MNYVLFRASPIAYFPISCDPSKQEFCGRVFLNSRLGLPIPDAEATTMRRPISLKFLCLFIIAVGAASQSGYFAIRPLAAF